MGKPWIRWDYKARMGCEVARIEWRDEQGRKRGEQTQIPRHQLLKAERRRQQIEDALGYGDRGSPHAVLQEFYAWLEANRSPGTVRFYRAKLNMVDRDLGHLPWVGWSPQALSGWLEEYGKTRSPMTVLHAFRTISAFLKWAASLGCPAIAPNRPQIAPGSLRRGRVDIPHPSEIKRLRTQSEQSSLRVPILLACLAGLRLTEIRALEWADVDLERRTLTIHSPKTHRRRVVPLHPDLAEALGVPGTGKVVTMSEGRPLYDALRALYKDAGVRYREGRPLHVLRHYFVSRLLATGATVVDARDLAGHASISTTNIYSHGSPERARSAVERL